MTNSKSSTEGERRGAATADEMERGAAAKAGEGTIIFFECAVHVF